MTAIAAYRKNNRWLQGVIPDLIINALHLEHLEKGAYARFGDATTLGNAKTLAPGQAYSDSPSMAFGASAEKRAGRVHEDYHKTAKKLDAKLGTHADATGPVETEMNSYNSGRVSGLVVGAFGGVSMQVRVLSHARQMRTTPRHTSTFIFTRPAAGVATATPARSRGLVG